ncbi:hypothetical protein BC938DRAFT_473587, partial [Jimgerdemannia flammicorona]
MFGGSQIYSNSSRFYYAAIYRFNIEIKTWSSCKPAGKWKIGFDSAVPVRFDGMIYLFHGGTNDMPPGQPSNNTSTVTNATYIYNVLGNTVVEQTSSSYPLYAAPPSLFNYGGVHDDSVIFVSGFSIAQDGLDGIWVYNFTTQDWVAGAAKTTPLTTTTTITTTTTTTTTITLVVAMVPSTSARSEPASGPRVEAIVGPTVGGIVLVLAVAACFLERR